MREQKDVDLHFLIFLLFTEFTITWTVGTKKKNMSNMFTMIFTICLLLYDLCMFWSKQWFSILALKFRVKYKKITKIKQYKLNT